jgi:hypothetical protein
MNVKVMDGVNSKPQFNPMLYPAALLISAISLFSIGCGNQKKSMDQLMQMLIYAAAQPSANCAIATDSIYDSKNKLVASCDKYLFVSYNRVTPATQSALSLKIKNGGVATDKHGVSLTEDVDYTKYGGTNAADYSLQFIVKQGAQATRVVSVTMKDDAGRLYSANANLVSGTMTIPLNTLTAVDVVNAVSTVTKSTEFSIGFADTGSADATISLSTVQLVRGATPVLTLATGQSDLMPSGKQISGFYLKDETQNVPVTLDPAPATAVVELTNPKKSDGTDNPDFNKQVFSVVNNRLRVLFPVIPVPKESGSSVLFGVPASGQKLSTYKSLQIDMQRQQGTYSMKINVLPQGTAVQSTLVQAYPEVKGSLSLLFDNPAEENLIFKPGANSIIEKLSLSKATKDALLQQLKSTQQWFTIKTYDEDTNLLPNVYAETKHSIRGGMSARDQKVFDALLQKYPNVGIDTVFLQVHSKTPNATGSLDMGRVKLLTEDQPVVVVPTVPAITCAPSAVLAYSAINALKAGCNKYISMSYSQKTSATGSYLTTSIQNGGVLTDRHGVKVVESVNFAALGGTNASNYVMQFDYLQGAQAIGAIAITMEDASGNLYSQSFALSDGISNVALSSLIPQGAAPALNTVTSAANFSFTFINTAGGVATPGFRDVVITHLGTPVATLFTGRSKKSFSGNDLVAYYLANSTTMVPLAVSPTPSINDLELTNPDKPEYQSSIYSIVNGRLRITPTAFPVPALEDSSYLQEFPVNGKSISTSTKLQINMQRVGTYNMKIHFLPEYKASVPAANRRWFTILINDQNNVPYAESYGTFTFPIYAALSAADQAAFTTLLPDMVGGGSVFMDFYNKTSKTPNGSDYVDVGDLDLIP